MDPKQQQQIKQYLNIVLRWKKFILGSLLVAVAIGIGVYAKTPKVYQAEALLVYQRGKIDPTNQLAPVVTAQTKEVIDTLKDQVLSRTSLEEIVKKFGLYQKLLRTRPMEDVIDIMRSKDIVIHAASRGDTFTVSYQGPDPRKVLLVTNALASKFVEENLRFREDRATETSAYIKDELATAKKAIEGKEAAMRDYKLKYYNEMPEQRQTNISRLNALQTNYQNIQTSMQDLERTKVMVQEQISLRRSLLQQAEENNQLPSPSIGSGINSDAMRNHRQALAELNRARSELESLQSRYTDQHPEVKRQLKTVQQLEEKVKETAKALPSPPPGENPKSDAADQPYADQQLNQLELQLQDIGLSMNQLKKEQQEAKKQIEIYQKWIAAAPVREAEWASLTRDYQQFSQRYQNLVAKNLAAASVENLERKQKGSQFKIVDPGHLPEKPFSPDFKKIILLSLLLGTGLGGAVAFCVEFIDSSFKEAHDLENYLNLPIVCSVPVLPLPSEKKKMFFWNIFWSICFVATFFSLIAFSVYLWEKGILII